MAQLFRITKLNDSTRCTTFTFILPSATLSDDSLEILSRDFAYAGLKWRLCLQKKDKQHLSPYLQLISVSPGIRCIVDVIFVLVNRETFSQNETYSEKQVQFDFDHTIHGHRPFVTIEDLIKRSFTDTRNEFLFELTLKQPKTTLISVITLCPPKTESRNTKEVLDYQRYDTQPFLFGDLEWVCVFCPNMDVLDNGSLRHMIQITRKSRLDSLCKLNYRVVLGGGGGNNKFLRTEMREEIFDFNGNGEGIYFTDDYFRYSQGNQLKLNIELYSISFINHLKLNVLSTDKQPASQCLDTDKQNWCLKMAPIDQQTAEFLTLTLTYADNVNIPREYVRYVSWNMQILPAHSQHIVNGGRELSSSSLSSSTSVDVVGPIEQYYSHFSPTPGVPMTTKVKVQDLKLAVNPWLDKMERKMLVQIEWLSSYLLVHPFYHAYDDIYRKQIVQMRREIQALQNENYSLEKDLHSYQLSIADKCGSGGSNPPSRTWSVSSNASNPSTTKVVANGGPAGQLHAKAALAAVSLLAAPGNSISHAYNQLHPNRRSSIGLSELSPDRPVVSPDRRLSVEHAYSSSTMNVVGGVSPTRSKSGGSIVDSAKNGVAEDFKGRLTPVLYKRLVSNRENRTRHSRENSPKHSPPSVQRYSRENSPKRVISNRENRTTHSRENSPKHSPPSVQRHSRENSPKHSPPIAHRRQHEYARFHHDVPIPIEQGARRLSQPRTLMFDNKRNVPPRLTNLNNQQVKGHTENRNVNLLCEPFLERGRSRSFHDFKKARNKSPQDYPSSPVFYEELSAPVDIRYVQQEDYHRRRQPSPVPNYYKTHGDRYFDDYHHSYRSH